MIYYAVVDDKSINRSMLIEKLQVNSEFNLLFEASNGEDFLEKMKKAKYIPQLVFMDIDMPVLNGIKTVELACSLYPDLKIIMLTVFDDDQHIFDAIKAGAIGYLLKDDDYKTIEIYAKEALIYGGSPMSPSVARKTLQFLSEGKSEKQSNETVLSKREMEILKLMIDGKDYKQIADAMFISQHTVRTHMSKIYKKLHVNNKMQALRIALKKGWFKF
jgi:DNA-binding NarL/FixJ family response regulator